MNKKMLFKPKAMQRDLSASAFSNEYAYHIKNMRIMPTDESTLLSLINEKGNKEISTDINLEGTPIGQAILNDNLIIFTVDENFSYIYQFTFNDTISKLELLYKGNLNFSIEHPIECIGLYENEKLQKIYWVDGINSPRVINIKDDSSKWNDNSFNFIPTLKSLAYKNPSVNITKLFTLGNFSSGVIQYAFTYYNKYSSESNIFEVTPLYYIAFNDKGASPEDNVSNSFQISLSNLDTDFEYVRIYSIHRTSINAVPSCRRVVDLAINSGTISYIDTGEQGDIIDPTELLYIGGEDIIAGTLAQKDNTLFLGNITLNRKTISKEIKEYFKNYTIESNLKSIEFPILEGFYSYKNQLSKDSRAIKYFKYNETYRFGLQFQHITGKWSEPIWLNDFKIPDRINISSYADTSTVKVPVVSTYFNNTDIINKLRADGYIRVRPVVVYPNISERECICQGVVCPTVFNVEDRVNNTPFVQSSWFFRPNVPFPYSALGTGAVPEAYDLRDRDTGKDRSLNSAAGILSSNYVELEFAPDDKFILENVNKGSVVSSRNYFGILSGTGDNNAEIQFDSYTRSPIYTDDNSQWVVNNKNTYFIDKSIVTLHSPEFEFDDNMMNVDMSNIKFRIVGMVPINTFSGDISIQTSTSSITTIYEDKTYSGKGLYKEPINNLISSRFGYRALISGYFWSDINLKKDSVGITESLYSVSPFQSSGSLSYTKEIIDFLSLEYTPSQLKSKCISNLRYSYNTYFLPSNKIWKPILGTSDIKIFNSNELTNIRLNAPLNSNLFNLNYYGNYNKTCFGKINICRSNITEEKSYHEAFINPDTEKFFEDRPIEIKYKSTPHAVLAFNYSNDNKAYILPTIDINNEPLNNDSEVLSTDEKYFWETTKHCQGVIQDSISGLNFDSLNGNLNTGLANPGPEYGWLWLGELYNDSISDDVRFGGKTEEAFENNQWLPCGKAVLLDGDTITVEWLEGDTYYQRYDNLKTYPFTEEDTNSIVEILSFMCETRINIDGRYDNNRGLTSNLYIRPTNFNLFNNVYSQENNFFNYRGLNSERLNLDKFSNSITWSKTKTLGELTDTWTNITMASVLDLDGDKGELRALKRFNNNLIAFQDTGISQILYNENMQIASTSGVPIEIANSGKVTGKRYITDKIGCTNKWSICETPNGLYFIDSISKGIQLFNGQLLNLSDSLGFHSWINKVCTNDIWNPRDFKGFVTYYDKVNGDVFFINDSECLAFSEPLKQFSSFYSYERMPYFSNIKDKGISINQAKGEGKYKLWEHNEGDYNMYFGKYHPFSITVIANADPINDKIFNNLEFKSDSWNNKNKLLNTTFDTLDIWNEYQKGSVSLVNIKGRISSLQKKFRVWRVNIPRNNVNNRDRIRNPWAYIRLSRNKENTDKTILHDMIVNYFE